MRKLLDRLRLRRSHREHQNRPRPVHGMARHWPALYLLIAALLMLIGHALTLGFPLATLILLAQLPAAINATSTASDWPALLLHLGLLTVTGLMSTFLWRQTIPQPQGRPLNDAERQTFDALIEAAREETRLWTPASIVITPGHQLQRMSVPRRGFALFSHRILSIGMLTLLALTPDQARAATGRSMTRPNTFRGWLLDAIATEHQCARQFRSSYRQQTGLPARIMSILFGAYLALSQRLIMPALAWHELEQDTLLVQQICIDDVLTLLAMDTLLERYLAERFWPAVHAFAKHDAKPPHPHARFTEMLHEQLSQPLADRWLAQAVQSPATTRDDRPSAAERLANLGCSQFKPIRLAKESAAASLLQSAEPAILAEIDKRWRQDIRQQWQQEHARHAKRRRRLAKLQRLAQTGRIEGREAMSYAKLAKQYLEPGEATAIYRQIATMNPKDAVVLLGLGQLILNSDVATGTALLKRAVKLDSRLARKARRILASHPAVPTSIPAGGRLARAS